MLKKAFKKLKALRAAYSSLPGIRSCREYEILIEIGFHQETGHPLTLKQLLLLDIASAATVRRQLGGLVKKGMVLRRNTDHDRRGVQLELSPLAMEHLYAHFLQIDRIFNDAA